MPDPVDELYRLPASEFVRARDRLAAKLAAARQQERAREVKALRRPSVAAWVVNQLAHRNAAAIRRLIDAGNELRHAQQRLVRGGSADALRTAAKQRQEALRELRRLAGPIFHEAGSATQLDAVLATLEAASVDPAAAKAVTSGRLSRELPRPSGFGDASPLTLVVSRKRTAPEPPAAGATNASRDRARARQLLAEAKRVQREAAESARTAARAAHRATKLDRARRTVDRRVQALREELAAAERRLRDAEAELARARADESRAVAHARELERSAGELRARAGSESRGG